MANSTLELLLKTTQMLSVVIGVVISVLSFNNTRKKEAEARKSEEERKKLELDKFHAERQDTLLKQRIEAAKPFLDLRQKYYLEAIQTAQVLANMDQGTYTPEEKAKAEKRFGELYWGELCLAENQAVEDQMVDLRDTLRKLKDTPELQADVQTETLKLAHALRNSLIRSWGLEKEELVSK